MWIHQTSGMSKSFIPEGCKVMSFGKRSGPQVALHSETAKRAKSDADAAPVMPMPTFQASRSPSPSGSCCALGSDDEDIASTFIKYDECPMPEPEVDPSVPLKLIKDARRMQRTYSTSLSEKAVLPEAQDEEVRGILARISAEHKAVKAETLATGRSDEEHLLAIQGLVKPMKPTPADIAFERQIAERMRAIAAHHADGSGPVPSMEALQSLSPANLKTIADMVVDHMKNHPTSIFSTAACAFEDALEGGLDQPDDSSAFVKKARADEASEWKD